MVNTDVAIIGAGPAGVTAAIHLKRAGIDPLLFEKERVGGLLKNANLIENYPGFPEGIIGKDFSAMLERHLESIQIPIIQEIVELLDFEDDRFIVSTDRRKYKATFVIVASGTQPLIDDDLVIPENAADLVHHDIFPLLDSENKHIVIIGGGDAAFDYALNLSQRNRITILIRGKKTRCLPLLRERAERIETIDIQFGKTIIEIRSSAKTLELQTDHNIKIEADQLVMAIGRESCLGFLDDELKANLERLTLENRLFMVGDVVNDRFRQASIAVGDGMKAAMKIIQSCGNQT